MIKIKDNIYNEKYVEAIRYIEGDLYVEINSTVKYEQIKNATFNDIEWEYDRFRVEADKDGVIFANRILEKKIKELEEENKKLKEENKRLKGEVK